MADFYHAKTCRAERVNRFPDKCVKKCVNLFRDINIIIISRPSGNFPDHPETFQTIRNLSRPSANFPDHLKTFQIICKLSRPSGKFPDHLGSFQTMWEVTRTSGNLCILACILMVDFIDTRKNFPDAQKLLGWQCHHETLVFLSLI